MRRANLSSNVHNALNVSDLAVSSRDTYLFIQRKLHIHACIVDRNLTVRIDTCNMKPFVIVCSRNVDWRHFLAKHRSDQRQESNNDQQQLVSSHMQVIKQEQVDEGYGQNQESSSQINTRERRASTNTDLIKPLKCPQCNMRFSRSAGLGMHMRIHKGVYPLSCTKLCGKTFRLRAQLNAHLRSHSDEKLPFSCRFCGRAFASTDSLKKHLRLHKGNKPFRCLDCGKNFARHGHLMAHKNVHRRNVQCSVCWEVLPSIGDLLEHRQSHPKKGMLKCPDCPLQFKFPVFLLRHVAVHERRRKLKELLPPKNQATPQKVQEIYKEEFKCGLCQENKTDT
uniref:Zinc finger protein Xfin-like n=1 Tax=Sinocyclocheilus rhinocerous TaxID=307959 RepID=A0A673J9W5_9TELE